MQTMVPVLLAACLAASVIVYFWQEHLHEKKLRLRVQKLYASQLFEDMIPMLRFAKRHAVEQLVVDKTGVVIRYLHAEGADSAFLMRPNGYTYLTPEQQEAMRTMLEERLPGLREASRYHVHRRRIVLLNGEVEYVYQYTMTNACKARLCRSTYYDGSLHKASW